MFEFYLILCDLLSKMKDTANLLADNFFKNSPINQ